MKHDEQFTPKEGEIIPSLLQVVREHHLDSSNLTVALPVAENRPVPLPDRHSVLVYDGRQAAVWQVASLRELFRGDAAPPKGMQYYPPECVPLFHFIETHLVTFCDAHGDKTDGELEEVYSNLRRRPDGRSLGPLHDFLWQVLTVLLGTRPVSQAMYEAVVGQLALSASHFKIGYSSRHCLGYLRQGIGRR